MLLFVFCCECVNSQTTFFLSFCSFLFNFILVFVLKKGLSPVFLPVCLSLCTCLSVSLPVCLTQSQGFPQVGDVVEALQFGHAAAQQEGEQVDEEAGVLTDGKVGFITHLLEPDTQTGQQRVRRAESETGGPALDMWGAGETSRTPWSWSTPGLLY